jgi:uncharacterized protein YvpB
LKQHGFKATIHIGNIANLKKEVSTGSPVIVFIKVFRNKSYLHYVPVVGYDEENFYIAESLEFLINTSDLNYNRKISVSDFKKLWNTSNLVMPFYKYIFITVNRNIYC